MPGRGTRHGSTATTSRAASSTRLEPRVSTSRPSTIDARAAKASRTHHAAASGARNSATKVRICASVFVRIASLPSSHAAAIQSRLPRANARRAPAATRAARQQRHLGRERGRCKRRGAPASATASAAARRRDRRRASQSRSRAALGELHGPAAHLAVEKVFDGILLVSVAQSTARSGDIGESRH